MFRQRRTKGPHHYIANPAGECQAIGSGPFTLNDDTGKSIGFKALDLTGAHRGSFHYLQRPSDEPCAVAQLPDGGTVIYMDRGYEDRLSSAEPFLAGFAPGMYQAYEHLADVQQQGGPRA